MEESKYCLDDFELYRCARQFRRNTYALIRNLPPEERYVLGPQMRQAAVSVTNNIAEGHGRWHYQENIQFCRVSRGSVEELIDDFNACMDEGYADSDLLQKLKRDGYDLIAKLNGYILYLRRSKQGE